MKIRALLIMTLAVTPACGPSVALPEAGDNSTGENEPPPGSSGASASAGTTAPRPPPPVPPQPTADPFDPTTGGFEDTGSSGNDSRGFISDPTGSGPAINCNTYTQDCPRGEKCSPWAHDGGTAWTGTRCTPVVDEPDQPGDPCTVDGSAVSGFDSCDLGSMCFGVDATTKTGTCTPHCTGSENNPQCDPGRVCTARGDSVLALCVPACDPLLESCAQGQGCYPIDSEFVCAPDASGDGGGPFEPCEFINGCDPGTMCISGESAAACEAASCCIPFCNVETPDCPGTMICWPWYEPGTRPPGGADIGYCADDGWNGG